MSIDKSLDKIKNSYKCEYKPDESVNYKDAKDLYRSFFGKLLTSFYKYRFKERLKKLSEFLQTKEIKLDTDEFNLYKFKINEIIKQTENIRNKISDDNYNYLILFHNFKKNYDKNENFPEAINICKNIFKDLLKQIAEICINYEKILLFINERIIDINNKLINLN